MKCFLKEPILESWLLVNVRLFRTTWPALENTLSPESPPKPCLLKALHAKAKPCLQQPIQDIRCNRSYWYWEWCHTAKINYNSRDENVTKAWTRILVESPDKKFLIYRILWRLRNALLQILSTQLCRVTVMYLAMVFPVPIPKVLQLKKDNIRIHIYWK